MTIMDKEELDTKKTKKKKKIKKVNDNQKKVKKQHPLAYKLLSFFMIIMSVITLGYVIYEEIFSIGYLLLISLIFALIIFGISFILNKTKLKSWIKNIFSFFSVLIIVFDILMLLYGTNTLKFLSSITDTGYRVETFGVYVLNESGYETVEDLKGKTVLYLNSEDDKNIRKAINKLNKEAKINFDYEDSIEKLLNGLKTKEADAIMFDVSYEDILSEEFNETYQTIKCIQTYDIVDVVSTIKSDTDITKDPFVVYISGIDTSGNVASKARSDVNLLLAVNPQTKQILMVNTPRDYYLTLNSKGKKDKLTHAGLYGVEESLNSLADLYDADIDYYVRINFTSFVKIIDALGGVTVNVEGSFCEQNSNRSKADGDLICLTKGMQNLNGEQALAYARNRHAFNSGDRARGEHQMQILEAIINKALSPKILTKYSSLINSLEGRVVTNMTTNEMYKFAKKQVNKTNDWKFTTISADGSDSRGICYSTGSAKAYVMEPKVETVEKIKTAIDRLFEGETNLLEEKEENE